MKNHEPVSQGKLNAEERVVVMGIKKAVTIIITAALAAAGGGFLGGLRLANNAVTTTFATAAELKQFKQDVPATYVRADVYQAQYKPLIDGINDLKNLYQDHIR